MAGLLLPIWLLMQIFGLSVLIFSLMMHFRIERICAVLPKLFTSGDKQLPCGMTECKESVA